MLSERVPLVLERGVRETPIIARKPFPESVIWTRLRRIWEAQSPAVRLSWAPAGAMAAGIALGFLLAGSFGNSGMRDRDGALFAEGDLARALTDRLAGDETGNEPSRIGVS